MGETKNDDFSRKLPPAIRKVISKQYEVAVHNAQKSYQSLKADEDAVTGALAHELERQVQGSIASTVPDSSYSWSTKAVKLRGRGKGAPEKSIGADFSVEIELQDSLGNIVGTKVLPVQAKNQWKGCRKKLVEQAGKLSALPGGGCVVSYGPEEYQAAEAQDVVQADGFSEKIPTGKLKTLSEMLGEDFLGCHVGCSGAYFDSHRQRLVYGGEVVAFRYAPKIRVQTRVWPN